MVKINLAVIVTSNAVKMLLCLLLCATVIALAPLTVIAGGPFEDFKNDALVVEAAKNILGMNRAELDAFIAYLASCSASHSGSMKDFYCERERTLFLVKFGRGRSIDRMIRVLSVIDKYFQQSDKSSKKLATKELANIERFVEVLGRFEDTASLRSRELIKEGR
jgi:hypothetical protein